LNNLKHFTKKMWHKEIKLSNVYPVTSSQGFYNSSRLGYNESELAFYNNRFFNPVMQGLLKYLLLFINISQCFIIILVDKYYKNLSSTIIFTN